MHPPRRIRRWPPGPGISATAGTSTQPNPQHTFTEPGVYTVRLHVTNAAGLSDETEASVTVYQTVPLTLAGTVFDESGGSSAEPGAGLSLHLYQADGETPAPAAGGSGPDGNAFALPANGEVSLDTSVELSSPWMVVSVGEGNAEGLVPLWRGFAVDLETGDDLNADFHLAETAILGRVTDTLGQPAVTAVSLWRGRGSLRRGGTGATSAPVHPRHRRASTTCWTSMRWAIFI